MSDNELQRRLLPRRAWSFRLVFPHSALEWVLSILVFYNPLLSLLLTFALGGTKGWLPRSGLSLTIATAITVVCFAFLTLFTAIEHAYYRRRRLPSPTHRPSWYFVLAIVFMPLAFPIARTIASLVGESLDVNWAIDAPNGSYLALATAIAIGFLLYRMLTEARQAEAEARTRAQLLESKHLTARLDALVSEMNPHLLFNALNTVASLIGSDPAQAEEMVLELAELYRGVLRSHGSSMHSLAEELRLCTAYLNVEKARFGDRLSTRIAVQPTLSVDKVMVPVLLLQPLVENAVGHGLASRTTGGCIELRVKVTQGTLEVLVLDDGVGLGNSPRRGSGRALANCRERLALI